MKDMGRQRVTCFVARRFAVNSATNNEIEKEKKKHEGLTRLEDEDQPANPVLDLEETLKKSTDDLTKPVAEKVDVKTFLAGSGIQVWKLAIYRGDLKSDFVWILNGQKEVWILNGI